MASKIKTMKGTMWIKSPKKSRARTSQPFLGSTWTKASVELGTGSHSSNATQITIYGNGKVVRSVCIRGFFHLPNRAGKREHRLDLLTTGSDDDIEAVAATSAEQLSIWIEALCRYVELFSVLEHPHYDCAWEMASLEWEQKRLQTQLAAAAKRQSYGTAQQLKRSLQTLQDGKEEAKRLNEDLNIKQPGSSERQSKLHELGETLRQSQHNVVQVGTPKWAKKVAAWQIPFKDLQLNENRILGEGSFGKVVQGSWNGIECACKMIRITGGMKQQKQKFQKEAQALIKLNHPNIIRLLCASIDDPGHICLVLEYADRGTIWDVLKQEPNMPLWQRASFCANISSALTMIHQRGIVHQDIKPENVLVVSGTMLTAKLSDLGSATGTSTSGSTTMGKVFGTLRYSAPEMFGSSDLKLQRLPAVDIYALGISIFEIIQAKSVWEGYTNNQIMASVLGHQRPQLPTTVPPVLVDTIQRCWSQESGDRPTALEVNEAISIMQGQGSGSCELLRRPRAIRLGELVLVVSTPQISLMKEDVMAFVEAVSKVRDDLQFGYDWAASSSKDKRDDKTDWGDASAVKETYWFKGYKESVKAEIKVLSQLPYTKIVLLCINGGPISQLEADTMGQIKNDISNDLLCKGFVAKLQIQRISFEEFKERYRTDVASHKAKRLNKRTSHGVVSNPAYEETLNPVSMNPVPSIAIDKKTETKTVGVRLRGACANHNRKSLGVCCTLLFLVGLAGAIRTALGNDPAPEAIKQNVWTDPCPECCTESQVDYYGADVGHVYDINASECCDLCSSETVCNYYTWRKNKTGFPRSTCYMKSSNAGRVECGYDQGNGYCGTEHSKVYGLVSGTSKIVCKGESAKLIASDCVAWHSFARKYWSWLNMTCGSNAKTDPCSCTFNSRTECNNGRITKLDFNFKGTPAIFPCGTIPSSLMNLTGLRYLDLYGQKRNGSIPTTVGGLSDLEYLNLANMKLNGTLPSSMTELTKLTYLRLGSNLLTGVVPPMNFPQMTNEVCTSTSCCDLSGPNNKFTCPLPVGARECHYSTSHLTCSRWFDAPDKLLWKSNCSGLLQNGTNDDNDYGLDHGLPLELLDVWQRECLGPNKSGLYSYDFKCELARVGSMVQLSSQVFTKDYDGGNTVSSPAFVTSGCATITEEPSFECCFPE